MKIQVKDVQTGQTGFIDDSELSARYQPVQQAQQTQQTQQTNAVQPTSNGQTLFDKLIQSLIPKTAGIVQDVNASSKTDDYVNKMTGTGSSVDIANQISQTKQTGNSQLLQQLLLKSKNISQPGVQEPQFSQDTQKQVAAGKTGGSGFFSKEGWKDYGVRGLETGLELGSYMVPSGKGAGVVSKALVPGAISGAMQSASKDLTDVGGIAKGAVVGGATSSALYGAGKLLSGLGKASEKGGNLARESAREIKQPASIWGSAQEKKINADLNKLGIFGSPSKQYSQLEPKMGEVEKMIQGVIKDSPETVVTKKEIVKSFMDNLKSSLRSKDITNSQAQTEINGYLTDLIKAAGGKGKFTNIDLSTLRNLKKLVNEDYGAVFLKSQKGVQPLNSREKVISAAWDSLDNAVKNASPELKKLLGLESSLFKAAPSLSAARTTPAVFRVAGTSVPSRVTGWGKDVVGRLLGVAGKGEQKVGNSIANLSTNPVLRQLGIRAMNTPISSVEQGQNETNNSQNNGTQNNSTGDVNHTDIISPENKAPVQTLTGRTPQEHIMAYQNALQNGDKKAADAIYADFKKESDYQKTNAGKPMSAAASQVAGKSNAGLNALDKLEQIIAKDPTILAKNAIPGTPGAREYAAYISSITDAIGGLRTGASVSPAQQKFYEKMLPKVFDSPATIKAKIAAVRKELQGYADSNVGADTTETLPTE